MAKTAYEVRSKIESHHACTCATKAQAERECQRLNQEAQRNDSMERGHPLRYEITTTAGLIVAG